MRRTPGAPTPAHVDEDGHASENEKSGKRGSHVLRLSSCLLLMLACSVLFSSLSFEKATPTKSETVTRTTMQPVMHTYFQAIGKHKEPGEDRHQNLVRAWETSWQARGWSTRVLNQEDAKKHKDYGVIRGMLTKLGIDEYNHQCYYRWLAMAAATDEMGGWMSDYDTFPLRLSSDEGRKIMETSRGFFSSFSRHVPALIYANATEWDRVLQGMIRLLPDPDTDHGPVNDMRSLKAYSDEVKERGGVKFEALVWEAPYPKRGDGSLAFECSKLEEKLAVHLSHRFIAESWQVMSFGEISVRTKEEAMDHRGDAALQLMKYFQTACL